MHDIKPFQYPLSFSIHSVVFTWDCLANKYSQVTVYLGCVTLESVTSVGMPKYINPERPRTIYQGETKQVCSFEIRVTASLPGAIWQLNPRVLQG